jgi:rubredoxin
MPNWVTNHVTITGEESLVKEVGERLRAHVPHHEEPAVLSFWNIIKPDATIVEDYNSACDQVGMMNRNNWYNWNLRNWGCKWDANGPAMDELPGQLRYTFDTAWSPPTQAMESLAEQYPDLTIRVRFIEEQGWGGEMIGSGTDWEELDSWDIPETHAEDVKIYDECRQCEAQDEEYMYDDCPK